MGALDGLRVLEFDAIGPAPFCGKLLADHGASIIRVGRPGGQPNGIQSGDADPLLRGRPTIPLDLKDEADIRVVQALIGTADALIEGYRPGVMERLGLGPAECLALNPRLVYGRITGYGQAGPLAHHPGHDINYISLTGALHSIGDSQQPPPPPLNLLGDYGGGAMLLAFGILAAHLHATRSGRGQVVDAAMVDGVLQLMSPVFGWLNAGIWSSARASNLLDGGAPFYRTYRTADGRYLAAGAIEPQFYAAFRRVLGLDDALFDAPTDRTRWPAMTARIAEIVSSRPLAQWQHAIDTPDACVSPVLDPGESARHPHVVARASMRVEPDGTLWSMPAPRLSDTPAEPSESHDELAPLESWPLDRSLRRALRERTRRGNGGGSGD